MENKNRQIKNTVEGDLAGGSIDKSRHYHFERKTNNGTDIKKLYEKFQYEKDNNIVFKSFVEELERYTAPKKDEKVVGLEAKLEAGKRENFIEYAIEQKHYYSKKLYEYQFYESAQHINIYLLGLIRMYFMNHLYPLILKGEEIETVNLMLDEKIIQPLLIEIEGNTLGFNPEDIMGMVYFLTGNCHIKWSK